MGAARRFLEELCDSPSELDLPFCSSVDRDLPVDLCDVTGTIPDALTQLAGRQAVVLPDDKPLTPAPVDEQVPF